MKQQFKVGDKVVALTDNPDKDCQPRKKGKIYSVHAVSYCPVNGAQFINLGVPTNIQGLFCGCGQIHPTQGLDWTYSKHFAPVEDLENILATAIENEDYELAHTLTQK